MPSLKIDYETHLPGTVKFYDRQLIVCTGHTNWPAQIEEGDSFIAALTTAKMAGAFNGKIRITACSAPSAGEGYDVYYFPGRQKFIGLTEEDIPALIMAVNQNDFGRLNVQPVQAALWLVCTHAVRDERCGVCGPQVLQAIKRELKAQGKEDEIEVWPSSHVGGHAYAGNVICYPGGNWYGRVSAENAADMVRVELSGAKPPASIWRGRMGLTEREQVSAAR